MTDAPRRRSEPTRYELRMIGSHLDPYWSNWFTGLTVTQEEDGTTSLCGVVTDQAELHGLLAKVRDLGATLLSVTPVDTAEVGAGAGDLTLQDQPDPPDARSRRTSKPQSTTHRSARELPRPIPELCSTSEPGDQP